MQHMIGGIEVVVAEVAAERPVEPVGTRLRDGIHLHARRPALRGIEPVRDELKLRDRVAAVHRLISGTEIGCDLLSVQIQLELSNLAIVSVLYRLTGAHGSGSVSRRQQRERRPVPALYRQVLHLLRIDIAAETRAGDVDERRLACDGDPSPPPSRWSSGC